MAGQRRFYDFSNTIPKAMAVILALNPTRERIRGKAVSAVHRSGKGRFSQITKTHPNMYLRTLFIALFLVGFALTANAQTAYIGGSLGNSFQNHSLLNISGQDFGIKSNAFAWKVFGGVGWRFIGLEGGYRDFGEVDNVESGLTGTSRTRGGDLMAKLTLPVSFLRFFGKAGFFYRITDEKAFGGGFSETIDRTVKGSVFAWGVGAGVQFGPVGLRLEYESMEINPDQLSMLSVGATIGIGDQ